MATQPKSPVSKEIVSPDASGYSLASGYRICGGPGGLKGLKSLHLGYQDVVDKDLKMIATLCGENLESLDISGCKNVTSVGIGFIRRSAPKLKTLYIYDTDLPDECMEGWVNSKDLRLQTFGPGDGISSSMIARLRARGVQVAEGVDESLITDAVNSICSFGLPNPF